MSASPKKDEGSGQVLSQWRLSTFSISPSSKIDKRSASLNRADESSDDDDEESGPRRSASLDRNSFASPPNGASTSGKKMTPLRALRKGVSSLTGVRGLWSGKKGAAPVSPSANAETTGEASANAKTTGEATCEATTPYPPAGAGAPPSAVSLLMSPGEEMAAALFAEQMDLLLLSPNGLSESIFVGLTPSGENTGDDADGGKGADRTLTPFSPADHSSVEPSSVEPDPGSARAAKQEGNLLASFRSAATHRTPPREAEAAAPLASDASLQFIPLKNSPREEADTTPRDTPRAQAAIAEISREASQWRRMQAASAAMDTPRRNELLQAMISPDSLASPAADNACDFSAAAAGRQPELSPPCKRWRPPSPPGTPPGMTPGSTLANCDEPASPHDDDDGLSMPTALSPLSPVKSPEGRPSPAKRAPRNSSSTRFHSPNSPLISSPLSVTLGSPIESFPLVSLLVHPIASPEAGSAAAGAGWAAETETAASEAAAAETAAMEAAAAVEAAVAQTAAAQAAAAQTAAAETAAAETAVAQTAAAETAAAEAAETAAAETAAAETAASEASAAEAAAAETAAAEDRVMAAARAAEAKFEADTQLAFEVEEATAAALPLEAAAMEAIMEAEAVAAEATEAAAAAVDKAMEVAEAEFAADASANGYADPDAFSDGTTAGAADDLELLPPLSPSPPSPPSPTGSGSDVDGSTDDNNLSTADASQNDSDYDGGIDDGGADLVDVPLSPTDHRAKDGHAACSGDATSAVPPAAIVAAPTSSGVGLFGGLFQQLVGCCLLRPDRSARDQTTAAMIHAATHAATHAAVKACGAVQGSPDRSSRTKKGPPPPPPRPKPPLAACEGGGSEARDISHAEHKEIDINDERGQCHGHACSDDDWATTSEMLSPGSHRMVTVCDKSEGGCDYGARAVLPQDTSSKYL